MMCYTVIFILIIVISRVSANNECLDWQNQDFANPLTLSGGRGGPIAVHKTRSLNPEDEKFGGC